MSSVFQNFFKGIFWYTFAPGIKQYQLSPGRKEGLYIKAPPPPSTLYHTKSILVKGFLKINFYTFPCIKIKEGLPPFLLIQVRQS
jgi:hypothetical protein